MACPTLIGSIPNSPTHVAFDTVNGYLYVHAADVIRRYSYPALSGVTSIVSDASIAGITCDSTGNLYYILNDGVGGDTTVYKRTPGGTTTVITSALGTTGAFGITWHPVDGMLYVSAQRFSSGGVSAVSKIDPSTGSMSFADTPTATPPFVSASGAPQATSDGNVWFFGGNIVYRINPGTGVRTSSGSADSSLAGNQTVIPLGSTVAINHDSGDREYSAPGSWSAYGCTIAGDVAGAAHSADWSTVVFVAVGAVWEISTPVPPSGRWRVGRIGFPTGGST